MKQVNFNQFSKLTVKDFFEDPEQTVGRLLESKVHHWNEVTETMDNAVELKLFLHLKQGEKYLELLYQGSDEKMICERIRILISTAIPAAIHFICPITNEMVDSIYLFKNRFISKRGVGQIINFDMPPVNAATPKFSIIEMIERQEAFLAASK